MLHQKTADALSLIRVYYKKGELGLAVLDEHIAPAADDYRPPVFGKQCHQRDMLLEIDIHEERGFRVRKAPFDGEKPPLQRCAAGPPDRRQHVLAVIPVQGTDL